MMTTSPDYDKFLDDCYDAGILWGGNAKLPKTAIVNGKTIQVTRSTGTPGMMFVKGWKKARKAAK